MHPSIASRFYIGALTAGPILVMSDRQEYFMVADQCTEAITVYTGRVTHVIAVSL